MRVCFDTNTFARLFSPSVEYETIRRALIRGELILVVSTEILFEYQEVIERRSRFVTWSRFALLLDRLKALNRVVEISPSFKFNVIADDPDDNKFADCAIAASADYVVTYDNHFRALSKSGFRTAAITPAELMPLLERS